MTDTTPSPHDRYVDEGYCPFVDEHKTWCNGKANHSGDHWALKLWPPPSTRVDRITIGDN